MNLPGVGFSSAVSKFKRKCLVSRSTTHYWSFTSLSCSWRRRNVPNEMRAVILLTKQIIIRCKFFFLFIGREPTTWPANNCLQIMVCSCAMSSNCVWLQIIFCLMRERNHAWYVIAWKKADRFASRRYSLKNKLGDRMIKQLWNSVIAKYRDLSVSRRSICSSSSNNC